MSVPLFLLVAWLTIGVLLAIFSWWHMTAHEQEWVDETLDGQIFGCVPPPIKWGVALFMVIFGPLVLGWSLCEAIRQWRNEDNAEDAPREPPAPAAELNASTRAVIMGIYGLLGVGLTAYSWASTWPVKSFDTLLGEEGRWLGFLVVAFVLPSLLVNRRKLLRSLRFPVVLLPVHVVAQLFPSLVTLTMEWQGGWTLGTAGALVGAGAGTVMGWLSNRWMLSPTENYPSARSRAILMPIVFAVLFGCYGAHNWAVLWITPDYAWAIVLFPLVFAFLGGLVGRPFLGMLTALPVVPLLLLPLVASQTVGWDGGWPAGIAGAAAGAAAGAVNGWLYNRWIMPEYDRVRAREKAAQPPDSTDRPGSSESITERS
jgi:hypothetical protein